jgi:hypothetical protein
VQFKETMRKLVKVSKADLDAALKEHKEAKPERDLKSQPREGGLSPFISPCQNPFLLG